MGHGVKFDEPVLATWDIRSLNGRTWVWMRSREENSLVGEMLFELVSNGGLAEQERYCLPILVPVSVYHQPSRLRAREEEKDMPKTREESWARSRNRPEPTGFDPPVAPVIGPP